MNVNEMTTSGFDYWFENFCNRYPKLVPDDELEAAKMKFIAIRAFKAGEYEGRSDQLGTRGTIVFDPVDFKDWFARFEDVAK